MSKLIHIAPSAAHRDAIRRSGYDLDNSRRRHPVQNPVLDRLQGRAGAVRNSPAEQLLRSRANPGSTRVRSLAVLGAILGGWRPDRASAAETEQASTEATEPINWAGFAEQLPALVDPIWPPIFLVALLTTALVSLFILARLSCQIRRVLSVYTQLPLFDQTDFPAIEDLDDNAEQRDRTRWLVEGASRVGMIRKENQDAFGTWDCDGQGPVLVLCDGAGGIEGGRQAAQTATHTILSDLKVALSDARTSVCGEILEQAFERARETAKAEALSGVTTAIAAVVSGDMLHYATLGDGALAVVWPDGMVTQLLTPHHTAGMPSNIINAYIGDGCATPARTGSIRLERGCTVLLMSDGAGDLFPFEAFGVAHRQQINAWKEHGKLADRLLQEIESARDPKTGDWLHHDNMTLVAAHLEGLGVRDA